MTSWVAVVRLLSPTFLSRSVGSSNSTVSLMLPCPACGKFDVDGFPGSSVDAVSSGGNRISEFKNVMTASELLPSKAANAFRERCDSPP